MIEKDPDVLKFMFLIGFANKDEMTIDETDLNDIDSDTEIELERRFLPRNERIERIKSGIEHKVKAETDDSYGLEDDNDGSVFAWLEHA